MKPRRVRITIDVEVFEPERLLQYVESNKVFWGFPPDEPVGVPLAVYEAIVGNCPPDGPLGVGCEITNYSHTEAT